MQLREDYKWIDVFDFHWRLGIDGLSLGSILLTGYQSKLKHLLLQKTKITCVQIVLKITNEVFGFRTNKNSFYSLWPGDASQLLPASWLREFFLWLGPCKYKLDDHSVGFLLQATLGGVAADFMPQQLSDGVFKFSVASRDVEFHIYNLQMFACDQYKIFHLYGNGGAHWISEFKKYIREEEDEWKPVLRKNSRVSFLYNSRKRFVSGANRVPLGRNRMLRTQGTNSLNSKVTDLQIPVFPAESPSKENMFFNASVGRRSIGLFISGDPLCLRRES
jgi:hypothetical protein